MSMLNRDDIEHTKQNGVQDKGVICQRITTALLQTVYQLETVRNKVNRRNKSRSETEGKFYYK